MRKDVSKALFELFEEEKPVVYSDLPLTVETKGHSAERYRNEIEEIAIQRGRVLRVRMRELDLCERECRTHRRILVIVGLSILALTGLHFYLPVHVGWMTNIPIALGIIFLLKEGWLKRLVLFTSKNENGPEFDLDDEIARDVQKETGLEIKIHSRGLD